LLRILSRILPGINSQIFLAFGVKLSTITENLPLHKMTKG
jgi:hypothetical protein